jgi:hypothetical protein
MAAATADAPSYDRNPQLSTSLSLVLVRVTWHCLLDHLGIELLPAFLNPSKGPVASRFVGLIVPFPKMPFDQSLVVERKCQLGVDSLLGTLLLEWDGVLEDVFLREVELHCLRCQ